MSKCTLNLTWDEEKFSLIFFLPGKAVRGNYIPTKILKDYQDSFAPFIYKNYNKSLLDGIFAENYKTAEVVPVYKKKKNTHQNNYGSLSILSNISNIYDKSFYNQTYDYFDRLLSKYQGDFSKRHSPQYCLFYMIEKDKQARDNNNVFAAVLTDLIKTFDCINHELLVAKLNAYGFDSLSLKFISAYLNFRKHQTKFGFTSSVTYIFCLVLRKDIWLGHLFSMFAFAICFSELILLSSPAMHMKILLFLPDRTTKN